MNALILGNDPKNRFSVVIAAEGRVEFQIRVNDADVSAMFEKGDVIRIRDVLNVMIEASP